MSSLTEKTLTMFADGSSKSVLFPAHRLLNQNAISDGAACYPAAHGEIVRACLAAQAGVETTSRDEREAPGPVLAPVGPSPAGNFPVCGS